MVSFGLLNLEKVVFSPFWRYFRNLSLLTLSDFSLLSYRAASWISLGLTPCPGMFSLWKYSNLAPSVILLYTEWSNTCLDCCHSRFWTRGRICSSKEVIGWPGLFFILLSFSPQYIGDFIYIYIVFLYIQFGPWSGARIWPSNLTLQ